MHKAGNRFKRGLLIILGTIFVGFGIVGIFLPLLPTTPFLLLAAWCYSKSSDRFYRWLLNNKWFGSYIKNYRAGKGVPLRVKILSVSLLWITILFSVFYFIENVYIKGALILIAMGVTYHIFSIRSFHSNGKEKNILSSSSKEK